MLPLGSRLDTHAFQARFHEAGSQLRATNLRGPTIRSGASTGMGQHRDRAQRWEQPLDFGSEGTELTKTAVPISSHSAPLRSRATPRNTTRSGRARHSEAR